MSFKPSIQKNRVGVGVGVGLGAGVRFGEERVSG